MMAGRRRAALLLAAAAAGLIALIACSDSKGSSGDGGQSLGGSGGFGSAAGAGASGTSRGGSGGSLVPSAGSSAAGAGGRSGSGGGGAGGGGAGATASDAGPVAGDGQSDAGDAAAAQCGACDAYGAPSLLANVQVATLTALSGIAVSARHADTLYAHNDRNSSELFALGFDGALRARFSLPGVTTVDLEDVAVGRCAAGSCVFVADIGGNIGQRDEYAILRAPEPELGASAAGAASPLAGLERFAFSYEDGMHNAEGILVAPDSGALYVVTKLAAGQPSSVYALPDPLVSGANVARKVADLPVPRAGDSPATATAAHPCGRGFLLRTNDQLYEFRIASGIPFAMAFAAEPTAVPAGDEPQSEAVAYLPDGRGFVTAGEMPGAPIYRSLCE
jgi:hypothetical protein